VAAARPAARPDRLGVRLVEALATAALVLALAAALRPRLPPRWPVALAAGFLALLPIPFLLQHRWPIFYPYDTPAMAFTAGGVALLLARRWRAAAVLVFFAALNRESAILLPLAALALHLPVPKTSLRPLLARVLLLFASRRVAAARLAVGLALHANPGAPLQLFVDEAPRLLANLAWLEDPGHWLLLPAYLGFVPLMWLLVVAWMPRRPAPPRLGRAGLPGRADVGRQHRRAPRLRRADGAPLHPRRRRPRALAAPPGPPVDCGACS
jgi:hypothetical protein